VSLAVSPTPCGERRVSNAVGRMVLRKEERERERDWCGRKLLRRLGKSMDKGIHTLVVSVTVLPTPLVAPETVSVSPVTVPPRVLPSPPTILGCQK